MRDLLPRSGDKERPPPANNPCQAPVLAGSKVDMIVLASLWIGSLLVVNPIGDFPLNDDWSFGMAVKRLMETGGFRPTGWTGMPLITQTFLGALFCLPAGFSFNALRLSTLVLAFCGMLATYLSVRQVHPSRWLAVIAGLTIGFIPIYYALSNTFMTDVAFTALLTIAALFFFRNLQGGSDLCLVAGTAFALAATLCRQLGIAVPMAFAISLLGTRGAGRGSIIRAIIPLAVCVGALLAFQHWLEMTGELPSLYFKIDHRFFSTLCRPRQLLPNLAKHLGTAALYLGWFSLPVTILVFPTALAARKDARVFIPAATAGLAFVLFALVMLPLTKGMMPIPGNIIVQQGIGPLLLCEYSNAPPVPALGKSFWLAVTIVCALGGACLLAGAVATAIRSWSSLKVARICAGQTAAAFFLLCAVAYLLPVMVTGGFDRYYVPALPFLLIGIAALASLPGLVPSRAAATLSVLGIGFLAIFAVCGTRDYFTWNRTRWAALNDLIASGKATPKDVDGGFEFNGWYLYDPAYKEQPGKSWWWVCGDSYVVTWGAKPGWKTIKEYHFARWLPPGTGTLVLLKREETGERMGAIRNAMPDNEIRR